MADLLKDERFCRWVKSVMALEMTRSTLIEFVEPVIKKRQGEIVEKMNVSGQICMNCSFKDADQCPSCKIMKDEITKDHRFDRPTFRNTSIKKCVTNPWELAKCYMAVGYEMACSPSDTDTVGFLHLIINNMIFQHHTSENLNDMNNIFQQAREYRNFIMHSAENQITKSTFDNQVKIIVEMLRSLHNRSSKIIVQQVKKHCPNRPESEMVTTTAKLTTLQLRIDNVSLEEIYHANSEAVKFFKSYEAGLRERIKECEYRMDKVKDTLAEGEKRLGESIERGVDVIYERTVHAERVLEDAANRGTELIRGETEAGLQNIADKTNQSTRILEDQQKAIDTDLREKGEQLSNEILHLKAVKNEALDKAQEIKATVELIDEKTNSDIDTIQRVTQLCMEKLCDQTKASGETMQDMLEKLGKEFIQRIEKTIGNEIEKYDNRIHTKQMIEDDIEENAEEDVDIEDDVDIGLAERSDTEKSESQLHLPTKTSGYDTIWTNVSHSEDKKNCCFSGMVKIDARKLAVVDRDNKSVEIIDVETNSVVDILELSETPGSITCIGDTRLVVACRDRKLLVLQLDGKLREVNTIELESEPEDVVGLNKEIGIIFTRPGRVEILGLHGETKRTYTDGLMRPTNIAADRSKTTLYVSDPGASCITAIYLKNNDRRTHTLKKINHPTCLTVDQNDNIYVINWTFDCIERISSSGEMKTLIDRPSLPSKPLLIEYCQVENKLYVGCLNENKILSFKIPA